MATTMKSNDAAIRAIQELLQKKCLEEPAFALKMASPSKSMEGAINYLCHQVQKSGLTCLDNQSVASILFSFLMKISKISTAGGGKGVRTLPNIRIFRYLCTPKNEKYGYSAI